ncbi:phosphoesterase, MJ0936 family [Stutzerimonas kunmingensis]|uniref:metallophosphoesterase family protein n=1 Tax=Stutzerimonas kunmingensis TaxID=1211807 RepID=UPI0008E54B8B|nr:metallophosphoesterase family protein [Stutzerimonas kunmingensis]MCQ2044492.1 metallophosphatase family protein [Stutzerimonas kunmingensis]SFJ99417.1 phosphoesterase, MJ0936 family [Stutzerimonas kunmingensis]
MKIALLSDLHANIYALQAVLDDLNKERVEKILVAGDLVGYYYWPREVIEMLMSDDRFICIRGNHEKILDEVLINDEAAHRYRKKYGSGYEACRNQLSSTQMLWLKSLPEEMRLDIGGMQFHVGHGALGSTDEYLYPDAPLEELLKNYSDREYTVFGHTHYPFLHKHGNRYLLNPGSVGQPRDLGGSASYIVVNTENQVIRFKRKAFDTESIIRAVRERNPELDYLSAIMSR